jgi:transcriptional regulator
MTPPFMYIPAPFSMTDRAEVFGLAASFPFATLVTHLSPPTPAVREASDEEAGGQAEVEELVAVSHLPLLVDIERGVLRGHLSMDNPQYRHLAAGASALAIFHGPHGYVSPSVYLEPGVPTWNYVVVHARGKARLVEEADLLAILEESVQRFDRTGWTLAALGESLRPKLDSIAGFEVDVHHLEGKRKLSQNRAPEDQARVVEWLERGDGSSQATAAMMRACLPIPR